MHFSTLKCILHTCVCASSGRDRACKARSFYWRQCNLFDLLLFTMHVYYKLIFEAWEPHPANNDENKQMHRTGVCASSASNRGTFDAWYFYWTRLLCDWFYELIFDANRVSDCSNALFVTLHWSKWGWCIGHVCFTRAVPHSHLRLRKINQSPAAGQVFKKLKWVLWDSLAAR